MQPLLRTCVLVLVALLTAPPIARAQPADQFFKGKVVNLYIGFAAGGTYDYYSRILARFIGKHIPGNPTIVAHNQPGAGSLALANFLYAVAPKDGTALGMITQNTAIEEVLRTPGVRYKAAEFNWIGRVSGILEVHFTWKTAKAKTIEDVMVHETAVAGTGPGSPTEGFPKLLNALAGTKFKVISGYPGSTQGMLAMERGEVDGACGWDWASLKAQKPDWLRDNKANILMQVSLDPHPLLTKMGVPSVFDFVKGEDDRKVVELIISQTVFHRSYIAPPDTPPALLEVLRASFDKTVADPAFLADAEKLGIDIEPLSGARVQDVVAKLYATPPAIVERARKAIRPD
jgi:tripartite-type tricarboxylate transporter receptor subunit TctC